MKIIVQKNGNISTVNIDNISFKIEFDNRERTTDNLSEFIIALVELTQTKAHLQLADSNSSIWHFHPETSE